MAARKRSGLKTVCTGLPAMSDLMKQIAAQHHTDLDGFMARERMKDAITEALSRSGHVARAALRRTAAEARQG